MWLINYLIRHCCMRPSLYQLSLHYQFSSAVSYHFSIQLRMYCKMLIVRKISLNLVSSPRTTVALRLVSVRQGRDLASPFPQTARLGVRVLIVRLHVQCRPHYLLLLETSRRLVPSMLQSLLLYLRLPSSYLPYSW